MNSQQRQQIRGLINSYSVDFGTESFIACVAETDGLLIACQALLQSIDAEGSTSTEWLQRECLENNVPFQAFLQEIQRTVDLFRPSHTGEDHYAVLGVSMNAGPEEIKQAYRLLSRRYHPDTASGEYRNKPEKFIAINKAYHALSDQSARGKKVEPVRQEKHWREKKKPRVSTGQRKQVFAWTLGLLVVLVVISTIAAMNYKKRAMLAGLQQSRGAFIPPPRKIVDKQPADRPTQSNETIQIPSRELPVKPQAAPEVSQPVVVERPKPSAPSPPAAAEVKDTKTLVENGPDPFVAKPPPPRPAKLPSDAGDTEVSGQQKKISPPVTVADSEPVDRQSRTAREATARKVQREDTPPDVVFNTVLAKKEARAATGKSEEKAKLAEATVSQIVSLPAVSPREEGESRARPEQPEKPDMQKRVDRFFADYIDAYEQRNLILFARFFDANAKENGMPFTSALPTYVDLFATTRLIAFQVKRQAIRPVGDTIAVDGQFKVDLEYTDDRKISGSGPIHFILTENGGQLLVKEMEYVFKTE